MSHSDYHTFPEPSRAAVSLKNNRETGAKITRIARLWKPPNSPLDEVPAATLARVAHRLVDADGNAVSAEDLAALNLNVSQNVNQRMILWGTEGNEIMRVVPTDFVADPTVTAYLTAIETAKGSCVSGEQFNGLHAFVAAEKAEERWSLHKRIYLPIWGSAAANSIDLVTGSVATLGNENTMTHAAGYIRGSASAYIDSGIAPSSMGAQPTLYVLLLTKEGWYYSLIGAHSGGTEMTIATEAGTHLLSKRGTYADNGDNVQTGFYLSSRNSGIHFFKRLRQSGGIVTTTVADAVAYTAPTNNILLMAGNTSGGAAYCYPGNFGLGGISESLTPSQSDGLLANLKTLWETCTGQLIP